LCCSSGGPAGPPTAWTGALLLREAAVDGTMRAMLATHTAAGLDDLRVAGDLLTRAWRTGAPRGGALRGDLAWWYAQAWPAGLGDRLRLWEADGETVAWSWFDGGELEYAVYSGDRRVDAVAERAILTFAIEESAARSREEDRQGAVEAWAADDDDGARLILAELGFERIPGPSVPSHHTRLSQFQRTVGSGAPIDPRPVAAGYHIRSLAGPGEIEARVAAHRAAFAPSKMRVEKYQRLLSLPGYRLEDDLVVEAPDGSIASFAIAWWDPIARIGEFEPVGTDPRHQRRGLAASLLCHGLRRYRELGAQLVQVFSDSDNAASEALYRSVGFRRRAFHDRFRRPASLRAPDRRTGSPV
jgi:ribosomal protein S18 acetylase RimI-like enzyme